MDHAPGFLKLVEAARPAVREVTVEEARGRLNADPQAVLMDVREDHEWVHGHAEGAFHLGKGILERDLEKTIPDPDREILMYCGGGFRSVLTAHAAVQMGYRRVVSIIGGYKAMKAANWPMVEGE